MSTVLGIDGGLGLQVEFRAELVPVDQVDPALVGRFLQLKYGRAQRGLGIAGLGRLQRRPAAQRRMGRLGPDLADDIGDLLVVEPLGILFRDSLGNLPSPAQGQSVTWLLADDLGPRMGRRDIRARRGREPIDQAVEPAVVVRFQDDGVLTDEHLSLDHRDLAAREARPSPRSGDDRAAKNRSDLVRLGIVGIERSISALRRIA